MLEKQQLWLLDIEERMISMKLIDLFKVHIGKSHGYDQYDTGDVAFVTNGIINNGIQGFVTPLSGDKVFKFNSICLSSFCEATVHKPPFVGRGNGGSGLIILEPKEKMAEKDLLYYASFLNNYAKWRFSYGRMVSIGRLYNISCQRSNDIITEIDINNFLPKRNYNIKRKYKFKLGVFPIQSIFQLNSGDYHNASKMPNGQIPLVSCGSTNNGILKFVDVPDDKIYQNKLTVAYNGLPLTTRYHPYKFATKDDVAICIEKNKLNITTLLFIQYVINRESWRFSYGRKCYKEKLSEMPLSLPINEEGDIDEDAIANIMANSSYWEFIETVLTDCIKLRKDIID